MKTILGITVTIAGIFLSSAAAQTRLKPAEACWQNDRLTSIIPESACAGARVSLITTKATNTVSCRKVPGQGDALQTRELAPGIIGYRCAAASVESWRWYACALANTVVRIETYPQVSNRGNEYGMTADVWCENVSDRNDS